MTTTTTTDEDEPTGDYKTLLADLDINGGFRSN